MTGNTHDVFVTIVFLSIVSFTDQTAVARMFQFLRTHMAAKMPIVSFTAVGSIAADHCHCYLLASFFCADGRTQWHGRRYIEPLTHGGQFADDRCQVRVCNALFFIMAEEINMDYEFVYVNIFFTFSFH